MATKQQEELAAYLLAAGITAHAVSDILSRGRLTKVETGLLIKVFKKVAPTVGRVVATEALGLGRLAVRSAPRAAMALARSNPYTLAAALLYAGYIKREELAEIGAAIADDPRTQAVYEDLLASGQAVQQTLQPFAELPGLPGIRPTLRLKPGVSKRRESKANKAVRQGMAWLKAGTKAATGAKPGKHPKKAWVTAVRAAGLANPKTKSRIGKGKSIMNKLARRLKKWW
jgi:hypothetical protein